MSLHKSPEFEVTITTQNQITGKTQVKEYDCENLTDATRLCHQFKTKSPWIVVHYSLEYMKRLV